MWWSYLERMPYAGGPELQRGARDGAAIYLMTCRHLDVSVGTGAARQVICLGLVKLSACSSIVCGAGHSEVRVGWGKS